MTMTMTNLPSDEQIRKLYHLAGERVVRKLGDTRADRVEAMTVRVSQAEETGELTRATISTWITWLEGQPVDRSKPDIPAGKYAVKGADGTIDFYQVDRPKTGKWAGFVFTKLLVGSIGDWREQRLNRQHRDSVEAKIAADVQGAAALFGRTAKRCSHCTSPLSDVQSRCAGYGQTCATNHGYWYPSLAEARELMGETS